MESACVEIYCFILKINTCRSKKEDGVRFQNALPLRCAIPSYLLYYIECVGLFSLRALNAVGIHSSLWLRGKYGGNTVDGGGGYRNILKIVGPHETDGYFK